MDAQAWNGTPYVALWNLAFLASLCNYLPLPRQQCVLYQARQLLRTFTPLPRDVVVHSLLFVG